MAEACPECGIEWPSVRSMKAHRRAHLERRSCSVDGCDRRHFGHGLCSLHYRRVRSTGRPDGLQVNRYADLADALWSRVDRSGDCWLWQGSTDGGWGYGRLSFRGKQMKAHRVSYELAYGPIPDGLLACHRCDTPLCVRPDHLFLGTTADNSRDMAEKGRHAPAHGTHNGMALLTDDDIRAIRQASAAGVPRWAVAAQFGVTRQNITLIVKRRTWQHVA